MENKYKKLLAFELLLMIIIVSMFSFNQVQEVKGDSNYSNYLTSESISIKNDRALILLENSGSSNNYRNYYETGFLFPSKLRNEMYSIDLTTNPSKYYFEQVYLDNLDSDYAFSDVENLGQYETNSFIENYTDITENYGSYYNSSKYIMEKLVPNENINVQWFPNTYTVIDETDDNLDSSPSSCIQASFPDDYEYNIFGMENISLNFDLTITNITVNIYLEAFESNLYLDFSLSINYSNEITFFVPQNKHWKAIEFLNTTTLTLEQYNNINILLQANNIISGVNVYAIYLKVEYYSNENILQEFDNNSYNYITNGSGISGLFPAEYSFTNDVDGSNPADWTITEPIEVESGLDNHNKIVLLEGIGGNPKMYNSFSSCSFGTIELWIRTTDITKSTYLYINLDATTRIQFGIIASNFKYLKSSAWYIVPNVDVPINNNWHHVEIDFEFTSGNYKSLPQNKIRISVNGTQSGSLDTQSNGAVNRVQLEVHNAQIVNYRIDAVDYSWTEGYYENRNLYDSSYSLNLSSNLQLERLGNSFDNIESLDFEYSFKTNNSCLLDMYLKNSDSNNYDLINSDSLTTNFQEFTYSFSLNYSYYSTLGLIDFIFYTESSNELLISIDKINLKVVFSNFSLNENGYHNIELKFNRKTSGSVNRGNISFNVQLYQNHFYYDYIESNVIESNYEKLNQLVNFTEINIKEIEIQAHIRYGLNTLDIEICNMYYLVLINYNYTFELFEQLRFGNNDGNYFRSEFAYSSMNFNRLNLTGIYGNYSSSSLSGLRVLRADTSQNFNRYFTIPYFDEKISLVYSLGIETSGEASEPQYPSGSYWTYETFRLSDLGNTGITVENWSVDFRQVYAEKYEAKYFYKAKTIHRRDLGNWQFKITGDYKVSFNFIRNAITDIINLVLLFFQYLMFLVVASFSYIFMYLGINILVLLWNTVVYYLFVALIWILWYLYLALYLLLYYIWFGIIWLYENYLIPFFEWFWNEAIPIIIELLIIILAHIIASIIWLITLGEGDYETIYQNTYTMLRYIADEIIEMIIVFVNNFEYLILFILYYLLLTGLLYLRYIYCKARGFNNRAEQLHKAFEVFILPIQLVLDLFRDTKQLVNPYS